MNAEKWISTWAFVACAMLLSGLPAVSYAEGDFEDVFIFGDSLSDGGNVWAKTGETSKAPYALVPTLPYAIGGHRQQALAVPIRSLMRRQVLRPSVCRRSSWLATICCSPGRIPRGK